MVAKDEFREALFFRTNTFEIRLPPLRERRGDIPDLARSLLARAARRPLEQVGELLAADAAAALQDYDWPGNVRELANAMEYGLILSRGQRILADHLPQQVRAGRPRAVAGTIGPAAAPLADSEKRTLRAIEMEHILRTLEKNKGHKPQTAQELGISLKTLYNKLNSLEEERRAAG